MKIGILVAGHTPDEMRADYGQYDAVFDQFLAAQGFETTGYFVVDMQFPDDVTDCDGWLITGSRHGAYEDLPFIPPLEDFIRAAFAADVPMVGICFGHQIIAQAMGGKVEKFADGWAIGRQSYDWGDGTIALNAWHQDQVVERPENATTLASNNFCTHAALVYGRQALTVQAHPEYGHDFIEGLAHHRGKGVVPQPQLDAIADQKNVPNDNHKLAAMIARFFRERVAA